MQIKKLVAIYARVSTSNQENEGTIGNQLIAINNYINEHDFYVVQKYIDEGWSGDSIVRPALDQLRMDSKKGNWEAVVIYDPDRLARRYSYQELVVDELKETGIEVHFVTTPTPKDGVEKILYGVQGLFAEYERAKIAERFRLGKVRKAKEGHVITTEAPYGYNFILKHGKKGDVDFKQGYYKINDYEAKVVQDIFKWVASEGLSLRKVILRLKTLGIKPRKSKRGVWSSSTLSTLLRNKTYIGEGHFGATYATVPIKPIKSDIYKKNKKSSRRKNPESNWIKIKTPKIIEEDLFHMAGNRLSVNFGFSPRNTKNEYLLRGKIWCTCGLKRTGEGPKHGKYLFYRCTDRIKSFPLSPSCKEKSLNARLVDEIVWEKVYQLMTSEELIQNQISKWLQKKQKSEEKPEIVLNDLKKEIESLKSQEERYLKAYAIGALDLQQFKNFVLPLKDKTNQLGKLLLESNRKSELGNINTNRISRVDNVSFENTITTLNDLNFSKKKAIVESVIDKVVGDRKELSLFGQIPIKFYNELTNNRYNWGTNRPLKADVDSQGIPFEIKINMQLPQNLINNPNQIKK